MPIYEYECEQCSARFEEIQKMSDPNIEQCPNCGKGPVRRLLSSPAIQFKGSGWYVTDYAGKGKPDSASVESTGKSKTAKAKVDTDNKKGTKETKEKSTTNKPAKPSTDNRK
jgi:putative FmdB family regulatory protein|tara:strand:+ start:89 stop:424 length:336 start_codon:yes stop_codon:yes gene_type:complete